MEQRFQGKYQVIAETVFMIARFETTQWTLILQAAEEDNPMGQQALEHFCRRYQPPLLAYARSFGLGEHDAQDVTQSFFQHLLEKNLPARADRALGRFRSFLLVSFRNFMSAMHRNATRQRRGGPTAEHVPLQEDLNETPDSLMVESNAANAFDRQWAHTLLQIAIDRLEAEQAAQGHAVRFALMRPLLLSPDSRDAVIAMLVEKHGMTDGAARTLLSRLRARFRDLVREEVQRVVNDPAEVDEEISHLLKVLHA